MQFLPLAKFAWAFENSISCLLACAKLKKRTGRNEEIHTQERVRQGRNKGTPKKNGLFLSFVFCKKKTAKLNSLCRRFFFEFSSRVQWEISQKESTETAGAIPGFDHGFPGFCRQKRSVE